MRFPTYSYFRLSYGPVLITSDALVRERMDKLDQRILAPWAEALALKGAAESLMNMTPQGNA
jgi:hypothetical protein